MKTVVLNVPDISCERTITGALTPLDGVRSVNVDIPTKQVRVEYDEGTADIERMKEVLEEEDYPVASTASA